ncbi:hypothetical protein TNCV_4615451 [Trichonephila clavipes]|nr:hypothetical protein TNCV_4615451 [Trichonephila clavipes]
MTARLKRMTFSKPLTTQNAAGFERVESLIMKDHRLTVRETAEQVQISTNSADAILCDNAQQNSFPSFWLRYRKTPSCS